MASRDTAVCTSGLLRALKLLGGLHFSRVLVPTSAMYIGFAWQMMLPATRTYAEKRTVKLHAGSNYQRQAAGCG